MKSQVLAATVLLGVACSVEAYAQQPASPPVVAPDSPVAKAEADLSKAVTAFNQALPAYQAAVRAETALAESDRRAAERALDEYRAAHPEMLSGSLKKQDATASPVQSRPAVPGKR